MTAAATIDFEMSPEERTTLLYQAGHLRWKVGEHQLGLYDRFDEWNTLRQTREYLDWCASVDAQFDNMYMLRCARRTRKTSFSLVKSVETAIQLSNSGITGAPIRGMVAIPVQKKIGSVLVPLTRVLFKDAPEGYFPEWRATGQGEHEHLYIEAIDARIRLVGLDYHPRSLVGGYLDFFVGTEMGFTAAGFYNAYLDAVQLQFQKRPWAWSIVESSEPEQHDHDFNLYFKPDAQLRKCFFSQTIRDNTTLSEFEIQDEIRRSGGPESATTKRELFNEQTRSESLMVMPEFSVERHVMPANANAMPAHAHCYVAMDPGEKDPLGIIWGFYDFTRAKFVVQRSFAKSNCRTGEAASIIKQVENELWGTAHRDVPATPKRDNAIRAQPLLTLADVVKTAGGLVWEPPAAALTYWDHGANEFLPNPYRRISDIDARMVGDLAVEHSINFEKTAKDDQYAQESALRHAFSMDWIEIWEPNGDLARQLESGMWQLDSHGRRREWMTTPSLGHLDCVAALIYLWRNLQREKNPLPPARIDTSLHGYALPTGVDMNTATGRPNNVSETRFREAATVRKWR